MSKRALRASARAARERFGYHDIAPTDAFRALLAPGLVVSSYVAIGGEADPALLERAALNAGCRIALPHVVDRVTPLRFLARTAAGVLLAGPFGLSQPDEAAEVLAPDIILTPLVAFDAALNRVGQGAGHYDRAFAAYPAARRIGVAYSVQQVAAFTPDPWDVPLHAIVTERAWITP